ncbi:MAG TPA: adenylate/guanylate cyclase domain-containing protein [Actinomycetota bacterium]|nr:adenylate/guanylate cyclase domain-containing protein [Actinomycetota bacterium]
MLPETKYARLGGDRIAYQVVGDGPPDLVLTLNSFGHVDVGWEEPGYALFLRTLASFSRVILFDRRGTGASDPLPLGSLPPWESYGEDLAAVLDEVGSEQAAIMAQLDASPMAIFFAGTRPERTSALILANASAKYTAADDYPIGVPGEVADALVAQLDQLWGTEAMVLQVPSRANDERFRRWIAKAQRTVGSPRVVQAYMRAMFEVDARPILPLIHAPTLVLHRSNVQFIPVQHGRYLAEHIPGAKLVELPGVEGPLVWEMPELTLDRVQEFLTGVGRVAEPTRVLSTVLFTDIVGSTERAAALGDRRWREVLNVHDELARRLVEEFGGRLVKTTGDGILATFDGPGRAIRCAAALRDELAGVGVRIRAGLHTGEVELRDEDVGGIAVHIAARVMAAAAPDETLTSRTVQDLVVGSDIVLVDRGAHPLKGIADPWQLYAVTRP